MYETPDVFLAWLEVMDRQGFLAKQEDRELFWSQRENHGALAMAMQATVDIHRHATTLNEQNDKTPTYNMAKALLDNLEILERALHALRQEQIMTNFDMGTVAQLFDDFISHMLGLCERETARLTNQLGASVPSLGY